MKKLPEDKQKISGNTSTVLKDAPRVEPDHPISHPLILKALERYK